MGQIEDGIGQARNAQPPGSWLPVNLLLDFEQTAEHLRRCLRGLDGPEQIFDAFLLAASLQQTVEDYLHRDVLSLERVVRHLPALIGPGRARIAGGMLDAGCSLGLALRARWPLERSLTAWASDHSALVQHLADAVANGETRLEDVPSSPVVPGTFPAELRRSVARLPHCFRSFDQRPEDLARLVDAFAARWPNRRRPLLVIGLRTAGSYLAPLVAGFLGATGYRDVGVLTLRPDQRWLAHERSRLRHANERDSLVLLVDEPPRSGSQFARTAGELEQLGVPRRSLVLLVPLFASRVPAALTPYATVPLPWEAWAIHDRLAPAAVKADLEGLLPAARVDQVERVPLDTSPRRGHVTALFRVVMVDENSQERHEQQIAAEGVGLGYLGRHALCVAAQLTEFLPELHGLRDGLLYRTWLPEQWRQTASEDAALGERIASYVLARHRALGAEDVTRRMPGRDTVPELVGRMLGEAYGRGALAIRPLVQRTAQQLLASGRSSVIDGSTTPAHWFAPTGDAGNARKVDFHARAFSNEDRACYDPVYDLACAAAGGCTAELGEVVANAYERLSGTPIAPERWLLYQLVHQRHGEQPRARAAADIARWLASERAMARAHQQYFHERFFSDLRVPSAGPLCALDVDWVLEVRWLGFPALSPAGAVAVRSLSCHGYRPVLVTGRSLGEVQERCGRYCLAGGVAEYGAVVYDHSSGRSRVLLSSADQAVLDQLRSVLGAITDVHLDPAHEHSIRAYRLHGGEKTGLAPDTVEAVLARVPDRERLRAIPARSQTDFTIADVDKGTGLRVLAQELGEERIALAVGDSIHDLPMLRLAERAAVPANADTDLPRLLAGGPPSIEQTKGHSGAGVREAATELIGHRPGGCGLCAPPRSFGAESLVLLAVLGALDGGAANKARHAAALCWRTANLAWRGR